NNIRVVIASMPCCKCALLCEPVGIRSTIDGGGRMASERGSAKPRISAYAWYALLVLVLVYVINFIDRQIIAILAQDIKRDLHLEDAQIGFLYGTAFAVFYALFGIP